MLASGEACVPAGSVFHAVWGLIRSQAAQQITVGVCGWWCGAHSTCPIALFYLKIKTHAGRATRAVRSLVHDRGAHTISICMPRSWVQGKRTSRWSWFVGIFRPVPRMFVIWFSKKDARVCVRVRDSWQT